VPGALEALHGLARELAVVAAVSGRPAGFLAERLEMERYRSPLRAIGLHGLEEWQPDGSIRTRAGVEAWRPVIEDARDTLIASVPAGVRVEDKGLGITVHWFSLTIPRAELERIAARATEAAVGVAAERGLVSRPGKSSVELAPPLGIDKGTVVTELCGGLERAGYLGDDAGDLLAFRALDELKAKTGSRTVKIAVGGAAAPQALLADADLVLEGPDAAVSLLVDLARILCPA
jgi:trehalose 6-phosphate phosphatase